MKRSAPLSRGVGPKRTTTLKPGKGFAASKEQRAKVKESVVAITAVDGILGSAYTPYVPEPVDPMHLTPRSKGGCDHPDCVVPAGRFSVHRPYDAGKLDLLTFLSVPTVRETFTRELQHMLTHLSPVEMVEQLANDRVVWRGVGFVPEEATQ